MSDSWNVKILKKDKSKLRIQVTEAHCNAGPFPDDPAFLMQLLAATAYKLNSAYKWEPSSPLGQEFAKVKSHQPLDLNHTYASYISDYSICSVENVRNESLIYSKIAAQLKEQGLSEGDEDWILEYDLAYDSYLGNYQNRPKAVYELEVTDPKWIQHLSPGDSFSSTARSEKGPFIKKLK